MMERKKLAVSVLMVMAVAVCLLPGAPAHGVIALEAREQISISAYSEGLVPMFEWWLDGPGFGPFQDSVQDLAVDPNGVPISAGGSQTFDVKVDAAAGTISGTFQADTWSSVGPHSSKWPLVYADSYMAVAFIVPEGEQAIYNLRGVHQAGVDQRRVYMRYWDPVGRMPGAPIQVVDQPGPFELSGSLPPGTYAVYANAFAGEIWWNETAPQAASVSLEFSVVPEPATVTLVLISLFGGSLIRRKR